MVRFGRKWHRERKERYRNKLARMQAHLQKDPDLASLSEVDVVAASIDIQTGNWEVVTASGQAVLVSSKGSISFLGTASQSAISERSMKLAQSKKGELSAAISHEKDISTSGSHRQHIDFTQTNAAATRLARPDMVLIMDSLSKKEKKNDDIDPVVDIVSPLLNQTGFGASPPSHNHVPNAEDTEISKSDVNSRRKMAVNADGTFSCGDGSAGAEGKPVFVPAQPKRAVRLRRGTNTLAAFLAKCKGVDWTQIPELKQEIGKERRSVIVDFFVGKRQSKMFGGNGPVVMHSGPASFLHRKRATSRDSIGTGAALTGIATTASRAALFAPETGGGRRAGLSVRLGFGTKIVQRSGISRD
jgi:hypothetical protein